MREEFDLDPSLAYLNAANQSLLPRVVRDALPRYQQEYERNPTAGLNEAWARIWEVQGGLARFLGADPADLFLRTNVTSVLNTFLLGLPLPPGSEILVGELEYGAVVNICRLRAAREGLRLRVLKMPGTLLSLRRATRESLLESVVSQLGPQTRMLLLSHVLGALGLVMPITEIASALRGRGVYLVVDGAYAPGALPVSLGAMGEIDFYGCSLYKWMMGPKGTAFGWVAKAHQSLLSPLQGGWTTFDTFGPFSAFGGGSRFQETFLMAGCHDFAPFRAIEDMLAFWERLGADRIRSRMHALQRFLEETMQKELGWQRFAPEDPALRGPLIAYRLPESAQKEGSRFLARALTEARVQLNTFWLRGKWNAVFSPHIHNSEEEIARALRDLRRVTG